MENHDIKVSIVIPTYKRSDLLLRLLQSIHGQTFKSYEIIVVDDHSPNQGDYQEVIAWAKSNFSYFQFVVNQDNRGAPFSRNVGINLAKADFVALVDDDDEWLPEKLAKQYSAFLEGGDDAILCYTWTNALDEHGRLTYSYKSIYSGSLKRKILKECFIPSPSVMCRKKALLKIGGFDESFPSFQDWDCWVRLIWNGGKTLVVPEMLTIYHKHSGPTIGTSPKARLGMKMFYRKHFFKFLITFNFRQILRSIRLNLE